MRWDLEMHSIEARTTFWHQALLDLTDSFCRFGNEEISQGDGSAVSAWWDALEISLKNKLPVSRRLLESAESV